MTDNIVIVTGGFDPIHSGHIAYINEASKLGRVVVGVNSDEWLIRKKGQPFMSIQERLDIVKNIKNVMMAITFDDSDGSASNSIRQMRKLFPNNKIIFANGGDRNATNIPEMEAFKDDPMVEFVFSVGGDNKKNSSSWILNKWKAPSEERAWGKFLNYYESEQSKVKRLLISPGKSISMQYHTKRSEFWFVEEGIARVYTLEDGKEVNEGVLQKHDSVYVPVERWHRLENIGDADLSIIEIQYGEKCTEDDIIRHTPVI